MKMIYCEDKKIYRKLFYILDRIEKVTVSMKEQQKSGIIWHDNELDSLRKNVKKAEFAMAK